MDTELRKSFEMFSAEVTIDEARTTLAEMAEEKANVDKALAAHDWKTLQSLGYASKVDGPDEGSYRWEFHQGSYDDLVADLALTPEQYVSRRNDVADW